MSIASDIEIREAMKSGQIVIYPFIESQLNNGSYNVTLGENYFEMNSCQSLNLANKSTLTNLWKYQIMASGLIVGGSKHKIYEGRNNTILCHTNEFIGATEGFIPELKARSSMARTGLIVAGSGGWGDVGFVNRWAFTIDNNTANNIFIPKGHQVAQIIFHKIGPVSKPYQGSYQHTENFEELVKTWDPKSILPK